MSNFKRWRTLCGFSFYKFEIGVPLEGIWLGTEEGKYGQNGMIETADGETKKFTFSVGLKDLLRVKHGSEIQITFLGKRMAKSGSEFNAYQIAVGEGAELEDDPV